MVTRKKANEISKEDNSVVTPFEGTIPKIKFKLKDKVVTYDLESEVQIDRDRLTDCLIEQPSKYAFVAAAAEAYKGASEGARVQLSLEASKLDKTLRVEAEERGTKITENKIKAMVESHHRYQEKLKTCLMLEQVHRQLKVCVEAFHQRMSAMITIANLIRSDQEMYVFQNQSGLDIPKDVESGFTHGRNKKGGVKK